MAGWVYAKTWKPGCRDKAMFMLVHLLSNHLQMMGHIMCTVLGSRDIKNNHMAPLCLEKFSQKQWHHFLVTRMLRSTKILDSVSPVPCDRLNTFKGMACPWAYGPAVKQRGHGPQSDTWSICSHPWLNTHQILDWWGSSTDSRLMEAKRLIFISVGT